MSQSYQCTMSMASAALHRPLPHHIFTDNRKASGVGIEHVSSCPLHNAAYHKAQSRSLQPTRLQSSDVDAHRLRGAGHFVDQSVSLAPQRQTLTWQTSKQGRHLITIGVPNRSRAHMVCDLQDPPFGIHLCGPEGTRVLAEEVTPVHEERVRPYRPIPIFRPDTLVQHYLRPEEMKPFYTQVC